MESSVRIALPAYSGFSSDSSVGGGGGAAAGAGADLRRIV